MSTHSTKLVVLDGKEIRDRIRRRIAAINKKRPFAKRLTLLQVCREAKTSIHTFRSWGRPGRNYSLAKVRPIDEVLDGYERGQR